LQRRSMQLADAKHDTSSLVLDVIQRAGFRALLTVPLLGADRIVGALVVRRKEPGEFPQSTIDLLETFGAQSELAIQNARLFHEIEEKSNELEVASEHKSRFLASGLIHSGDSQMARSSSSSRHESRNCRQRHPSGPPST